MGNVKNVRAGCEHIRKYKKVHVYVLHDLFPDFRIEYLASRLIGYGREKMQRAWDYQKKNKTNYQQQSLVLLIARTPLRHVMQSSLMTLHRYYTDALQTEALLQRSAGGSYSC